MPPRKAPKERGALPPSRKKKNTPHHGANTAGHPNPPVRDPSEEEAKEGSPSPSASLPSQQPTPEVGSKEGPTSLLAPSPSQHPTQEGVVQQQHGLRGKELKRITASVRVRGVRSPAGKGKRKQPHPYGIGFSNEDREPSYRPTSSNFNTPPPRARSTRKSPRKPDAMGYIDPDNVDDDLIDEDESALLATQKSQASTVYAISAMKQKSPIELAKKYMRKIATQAATQAVNDRLAMAGVLASMGSSSDQDNLVAAAQSRAGDVGGQVAAAAQASVNHDDEQEDNDEDDNMDDDMTNAHHDDEQDDDDDDNDPTYKPGDQDNDDDDEDLLGDFIDNEGVGDDDIVTERNVDDYTEYGLVKSTINYDDDSAFEDDEVPQDMKYFRDKNGRPGRALMDGGPQRPCTEGMTKASADHAIDQWRKLRKKWTDALAAQKNKRRRSMPVLGEESDSDDGIEYTGESIPTLRQMRDVETKPLCVGHNFKYKETCLIRIAEEANLHHVEIATTKSCDKRINFVGRKGSSFHVKARLSASKGYSITKYTKNGGANSTIPDIPPDDLPYVERGDADNEEEDSDVDAEDVYDDLLGSDDEDEDDNNEDDDILGQPQAVDDSPKKKRKKRKKAALRTPMKHRWIVPLIEDRMRERPNLSNNECKHLLRQYVRADFATKAILQHGKLMCRFKLFGNPDDNATYIPAMLNEMMVRGHKVKTITKTPSEVMTMLEKIVVQEEADRQLALTKPAPMTARMKKQYVIDWKEANQAMLQQGGLGIQMIGEPTPKFCAGVFFSMSYSQAVVPHLQDVFQADAAHTNFGKYTLYSCYGSTANGNTSPIAFALLFGNEDKAGWEAFWEFAKEEHPCLDSAKNTFITDQAKGLVESVKNVLPQAGHFHCSYHRAKNIDKYCKGGKKVNSAWWYYQKLLGARTARDVEQIQMECATKVSQKAMNYVNALNNHEQYPGVRCHQHEGQLIYMYGRTASSSAESMNHANKPARDRTAVDIMQSMKLIVELETGRFNAKKEKAHEWDDFLTPHGNKLRDEIFANVNYQDYHIVTGEYPDRWAIKVKYKTQVQRQCYFIRDPEMGSHFGACSCGKTETESLPCHHMVAVVKSGRIPALTSTNCMPKWYTTEMWRRQYPQNEVPLSDFSLESLKDTLTVQPDMTMRYCPPYTAPNKAGRPKEGKRRKSYLEEKRPKKRKGTALEATEDWKKKQNNNKKVK